jgi:hypothetical protein
MPAPPLSIPEAWRRLRLPGEPPARDGVTFCSPFRYDKHPGCFLDRHLTGYCDFGAGINTGLIGFIALGLDLPHESEVRARLENGWMRQRIDDWLRKENVAPANVHPFPRMETPEPPKVRSTLYLDGLVAPTEKAIHSLAKLRGLPVEGVKLAVERGLVVFGSIGQGKDKIYYWGLHDETAGMLSVRRMDGQLWPQIGNVPPHKAKTPKGWPGSGFFGIPSLKDKEYVILVEGLPDDLAAHCLLASGQFPSEDYGVVCALSAKSRFTPAQVEALRGRSVLCIPQNDVPSYRAAIGWQAQLEHVAVPFLFKLLATYAHGAPLKDLNDDQRLPPNVVPMESAA